MATRRWTGGAATLPHKYTLSIDSAVNAFVYGVTLNGVQATYTASVGSDTVSTIAAAVAAACATAKSVYSELTISVSTATITFQTADGRPFTLALVNGSNQTLTNTQTGTGPNFASDADNWSGQTLPTGGDTVIFENADVDCLYDLDQFASDTFAELRVEQSFTGRLGLLARNTFGFEEYRPHYFECGATLLTIGRGDGAGSPRIKIDLKAVQSAVTVHNSGSTQSFGGASDNYFPIILKGTHASNTLHVLKGKVDVAPLDTESATFSSVVTTYRDNQSSDAQVRCGPGVTLTTVQSFGGQIELEGNTTDLVVQGGAVTVWGGTHADIDLTQGGTVLYAGGTITDLSIAAATFDCSMAPDTIVVSNPIQLYAGAKLLDPNGRIQKAYDMVLNECRLQDVQLAIGSGETLRLPSD